MVFSNFLVFCGDEDEIAVGIQAVFVGDEGLVVANFEYAVFRADHKTGILDGNAYCLLYCAIASVGGLIYS